MAPAGLEGSGGGSNPGGLLNHDPVGIQPRLTSFSKYKCRESSCPTINSDGLCHWVGLFWDELGSLSYLPSQATLPGDTPTELIKYFAASGSQFLQAPLKKNTRMCPTEEKMWEQTTRAMPVSLRVCSVNHCISFMAELVKRQISRPTLDF